MSSAKPFSNPIVLILAFATSLLTSADDWQPAKGPLVTRWAKDVSPKKAHPEYPRPQLVRKDWLNLNGLWEYAIAPREARQPENFQGKILVPFPVESALSGVMKMVGEQNRLWYRRSFKLPGGWKHQRLLLHFGAVDFEATVMVNGREIGAHRGGYDAFAFDITQALRPSGEQELVVAVFDPTDASTQPRGKQVRNPRGIWYTPTSGIWQTVWIEPVSETSIDSIHVVPDIDSSSLRLTVNLRGQNGDARVEAIALDGKKEITKAAGRAGQQLELRIPNAKLWSPDSPQLYNLRLTVRQGNKTVDRAESYFGMRKISLGKDEKGILRLCLNNKPLFQYGPLDQGFWPDGIYTAPTDEALRYDIEVLKKLGCNMARKHVKIEPDRWYYWCDKLGLLVWQDMPSGDRYIGGRDPDIQRGEASAKQFELELKQLIQGRGNHPCIVMWVPFNEGWGQYDTKRIVDTIKRWDPSRLVDNTSGWSDRGVGDVHDIHVYPGPGSPKPEPARAAVLGEFGGLGLPISGHTWQAEKNWGYRSFKTREELTEAYVGLIEKLHPLIGVPGLSAAVYTQTTDVEVEVNGLMTYDRALIKADEARVAAANKKLFTPPPPPKPVAFVVPTSQDEAQTWRYTTDKPAGDWFQPSFDDSAWKTGRGGFGTEETPAAVVKTRWNTPDIWLRRTIDLPAKLEWHRPQFLIHHDEDAEIYLNGKRVLSLPGYSTEYESTALTREAREALRPGKNVLAVHCKQTGGGQYIDVGIVDEK